MIQRDVLQRIYRILFLLFIAAGTIRLSAQTQSSDVGVWIVDSELAESTIVEDNDDITIDFEEQVGYGISFNHFWTERFSTEIAAQKFGADMIIGTSTIEGDMTFNPGEIDITSVTVMGQMHFRRATRFAPYLGAGIARIWGDFEPTVVIDEPTQDRDFDLEAETTWTAAVGANMRITNNIYFVGEMKYIPWEAIAEEDPDDEAIDVNPFMFAAGVKVRF
jgi:outer membrane protein W